jgi:uncharacterized protein
MLYDNAQLLSHMAMVQAETEDPLLRQRVEETVAWTLREMIADGGGFAATQDADSEGEEGKFYVWQKAEIEALLAPDDAALFCDTYDVRREGNWEHKTILRRSLSPALRDGETEARLARAREALFKVRETRTKPGWDDKVLADWNGLMIAALADLSMQYEQPEWLAAAQRAFAFVTNTMSQGDRLGHSWRNDKLVYPGLLDDYANMMGAALALYEATGSPDYLDHAKRWGEVVEADYADAVNGGYFLTARNAEALVARTRTAADNATPSGNGTLVSVFARLWYLTGELDWRERVQNLLDAFAGEVARNFFPMGAYLNGFDLFNNAVQVAIIGRRGEAATDALVRAAYRVSLPNRIIQVTAPDATLPESHPAAGKMQIEGKPTAYVCLGPTCGLPVTTPGELIAALKATRAV